MCALRTQFRYLNPYELHKIIINQYVLKQPEDIKLLQRNKSNDRTDYHVLVDHHRFLWEDNEPKTWEEQFAKRYFEKLFKEYCIADLSRYKENKVALRWRIEKEVVSGKGQFICGNKICNESENLRSWEVNFAYHEQGERKNALVKIRLCPSCSKKLNYHHKKREIKRLKKQSKYKKKKSDSKESGSEDETIVCDSSEPESSESRRIEADIPETSNETPWEEHKPEVIKSREEEMEDYLQDLLI
ncbi:hypothetical protein ABEB36_007040 [Hypothenemus hampei]|uniref:Protein FRA10AC1 n=1 Tax=Hypothenemus hampei TaxID=57062 RepID=A0ABD1ESN6_HYPHA